MLDRLLETRRTHRKAPLPRPAIAVEAAYRIQDELREALVARGERVIGWKAGLTGRARRRVSASITRCRASSWATACTRRAKACPSRGSRSWPSRSRSPS